MGTAHAAKEMAHIKKLSAEIDLACGRFMSKKGTFAQFEGQHMPTLSDIFAFEKVWPVKASISEMFPLQEKQNLKGQFTFCKKKLFFVFLSGWCNVCTFTPEQWPTGEYKGSWLLR